MIRAYAIVTIRHEIPYDFDERRGVWLRKLESEETVHNILTDAGRRAIHTYVYGTPGQRSDAGLSGAGFNYIGLSNDVSTPSADDTVLAGELTGFGLIRAQGTVTLPVGSETTTVIVHQFTNLGIATQSVRKAALFDAPTDGKMAHEVLFSPKLLRSDHTLTMTFNITLT